MKKRLKQVLDNENGSPMTETIIAIAVSLGIITAIILLGSLLMRFIAAATASVVSL